MNYNPDKLATAVTLATISNQCATAGVPYATDGPMYAQMKDLAEAFGAAAIQALTDAQVVTAVQ